MNASLYGEQTYSGHSPDQKSKSNPSPFAFSGTSTSCCPSGGASERPWPVVCVAEMSPHFLSEEPLALLQRPIAFANAAASPVAATDVSHDAVLSVLPSPSSSQPLPGMS